MSFDIAPVDRKLYYDINKYILGYLDSRDIGALFRTSKDVRNNTIAALPAQKRLWAAARALNVELIVSALKEGARVNKIDPNVSNEYDKSCMNAFAIVNQKYKSSKESKEDSEKQKSVTGQGPKLANRDRTHNTSRGSSHTAPGECSPLPRNHTYNGDDRRVACAVNSAIGMWSESKTRTTTVRRGY